MTRAQAGELLKRLRLNYATARQDDDVDAFWLDQLLRLDYAFAEPAVQGLVEHVKFWPTLAEFLEQLEIVRERARRLRSEEERALGLGLPERREPPDPATLARIEQLFGRTFPELLKSVDDA
jgi:hypothetical protein